MKNRPVGRINKIPTLQDLSGPEETTDSVAILQDMTTLELMTRDLESVSQLNYTLNKVLENVTMGS